MLFQEDINVAVTIAAEYVVCGPKLIVESQLVFLTDGIRIQCTDVSGKEFVTEHRIGDIDRINCQWAESVGSFEINLISIYFKLSDRVSFWSSGWDYLGEDIAKIKF